MSALRLPLVLGACLVGCTDATAPDTGPSPTDTPTTSPDPDPDTDPTPPTSPAQGLVFEGASPRNVIVVSLDTTRRDFVGRYANNGKTPNLDGFLAQSVVLDQHRSCSSWTAPSMTCVVTGRTPFELGWWPWANDEAIEGFDTDLPTLAWTLNHEHGFRTGLITANTVFDNWFNFDRGFNAVLRPSWRPANVVTNDALGAADVLADQSDPFYLHVHYIDPHDTYCPPESWVDADEYLDTSFDICTEGFSLFEQYDARPEDWRAALRHNLVELYEAELAFWDSEFARLWSGLEDRGLLDDALVVFVTDHGEQLFDRGSVGHGITLGSEENRAVAAFWARNLVPQAWSEPTVHQDLYATILDVLDIPAPAHLSGQVLGHAPTDRILESMLYWSPGAARISVVQGDHQLTYDWWGAIRFYDLTEDPTGLTDAYDPTDPRVLALRPHIDAFAERLYTQWPSVGLPTSPD